MSGENNGHDENAKSSQLFVLFAGYSEMTENKMIANCSCVLIKGPQNVIIDTRTSWDGHAIVNELHKYGLNKDDINYVICTHGHSDHIGCNYLFLNAIHIVGFSISQKDTYFLQHDFTMGTEYVINDQVKVVPTPGHTLQDVTVIFKGRDGKITAITGDLFEKEEDIKNDQIWINAGSDSESLQRQNRIIILGIADYIIPGHGPMFEVLKN